MRTSMLLGLFDWVGELLMNLLNIIPKVIYLFYASLACVLDVLQLFFRKLAGLDVYYQMVDGKLQTVTGDLVTNFIEDIVNGIWRGSATLKYPALTTVFWSMIIFGVIVCVGCVFVAVIKSHYTYDEKAAKGPMQYVYTGLKSIVNIVAVPVIVLLGLWVSQSILTALDQITSTTSGDLLSLYGSSTLNQYCDSTYTSKTVGQNGSGDKSYIFYDIFGVGAYIAYQDSAPEAEYQKWVLDTQNMAYVAASAQTFSGSLFKAAAYNANRARLGQLNIDNCSGGDSLFREARQDPTKLADMIDEAFANHLHLKDWLHVDWRWANSDIFSRTYFTSYNVFGFKSFSKFNVGMVWYYYDLWQFNFIVGFGAIIVCLSLFINIILGLMARLFMAVGLFLIAPPIFAIEPLDGGKGKKGWIENFVKQVLMTYGAVVGMNIFFIIFPYINQIKFFNIAIADYFVTALFIIVGLITIKAFIGVISGLIGGGDAQETGNQIQEQVGQTVGKATTMALAPTRLMGRGAVTLIDKGREKHAEKRKNKTEQDFESQKGNYNEDDHKKMQEELEKAKLGGNEEKINSAKEKLDSYETENRNAIKLKEKRDKARSSYESRQEAFTKSKDKLKKNSINMVNAITTPFESSKFVAETRKSLGISTLDEVVKKKKEDAAKDQEKQNWNSLLANTSQTATSTSQTATNTSQTATNTGEANRLLATGNTQRRDIANNTRATADHTLRANQELLRGNAQRGRIETNTANTAANTFRMVEQGDTAQMQRELSALQAKAAAAVEKAQRLKDEGASAEKIKQANRQAAHAKGEVTKMINQLRSLGVMLDSITRNH